VGFSSAQPLALEHFATFVENCATSFALPLPACRCI
jgi:hypothetical protein